jgi:hypothetical protein
MKLKCLGIAVAAAVSFGWAGGANATITDLGTSSPLTFSGVSGLSTLVFSPSPDSDTKLVTGSDFSNFFLPQNAGQIATGIESVFGLSTAPTFISSPGNAGAGTFTATSAFNYAAVHQGQAEFVFYFATPQTSITFGSNTPNLSGINFYRGVAAVPEPATWGMMLLGFVGLAFAFRQSRRKVSFA